MSENKLEKLFQMQQELNDRVFREHKVKSPMGNTMSMRSLIESAKKGKNFKATSSTNVWFQNYLKAMKDEVRELDDELLWKWWSGDSLDMQNIKVEIIDIFHFAISLAMVAGMNADDLFRVFLEKNRINHERQDNNYSKETKNEDDCRQIGVE